MKTKLVLFVTLLLTGVATLSFSAHNVTTDPFSSAGEEAIPQLMEAAAQMDPTFIEMKIQAIQRLGELGAEEAVPILIEALGYGSQTVLSIGGTMRLYPWKVRVVAAKALADIGDARAVHPLAERAWDRDEEVTVKRAAVQALGLLGETAKTKEVLNFLFNILETTRDNGLAADVCDTLGLIGDKSAFVPLLRVTQGDFLNYVKERAQIAISKLQWNEPSVYDQ